MKKLFKIIHANFVPITQIILLGFALILPHFINLTKLIADHISRGSVDFSSLYLYLIFISGNFAGGIVLFVFGLREFRKVNSEKIFNSKSYYHNYYYWWYWICGKILGFKKCNLVRVPIFMQFKLVTRQTFEDYLVGENYASKKEKIVLVTNSSNDASIINLVLSDTYPIESSQIPKGKEFSNTIWISRENKKDSQRYYNKEFVKVILNSVRSLNKSVIRINVFATTNPKHTLEIVESVFNLGGRDNIKSLYVYQQNSTDERIFETIGYKIY